MLGRLGVLVGIVGALGCGQRGVGGDAGTGDGEACEGPRTCTQQGCPAPTGDPSRGQVRLEVPIGAPLAALTGSNVTGCRNDACVSGTLPSPDTSNGWPWVSFPANDVYLAASVLDYGSGDAPVLKIGWGLAAQPVLPDPQDGDRYSVEMTTSAGVLVAAASGVASYHEYLPNGPCCSPTCYGADVTMTPDAGADQ